uniref:Uncharacterized protein n=1 Tax=Anguilla anguilla TaxID=7936 RepID=A0A0E9QC34_ANGAN
MSLSILYFNIQQKKIIQMPLMLQEIG